MKWWSCLHSIAIVARVVGVLALIGAWIATANGSFIGLTEQHLFNDAISLLLVSIAFDLGALIHLKIEK